MMNETLAPTITNIVTQLSAGNQNMSRLIQTLGNLADYSIGTISWAASSSVTVSDPNVTATSYISWVPTSASAATLMANATNPYLSARTTATSFTLTTANGGAAAGTETFSYILLNPTV